MSVYKKEGRDTYSFDFRYRGQRFSGNTDCTTKRDAERVEQAFREKCKAAAVDLTAPMTFAVASTLYWDEKGQHLANSSDEERYLAWLQTQIGNATRISDISDRTIAAAVAKRRGEGVSNATVNRSVTQPLRAILRRCDRVWKQTVQRVEWSQHFLPEAQERVREATIGEEAALLGAMRGDYAPALRFAMLTGCRREEIVGLRWQHVDFFNDEFTVTGKREKSRTIPMTTVVRALLWSLKDNHPNAVFTYVVKRVGEGRERGQRLPITMEGFKTEWRRTRGRTDVENFRFHDTRHTAATRLTRATGNLKQVQRLLGHTELATTARYAHVTTEDLRAGLEAANTTKTPTEAAEVNDSELKAHENQA